MHHVRLTAHLYIFFSVFFYNFFPHPEPDKLRIYYHYVHIILFEKKISNKMKSAVSIHKKNDKLTYRRQSETENPSINLFIYVYKFTWTEFYFFFCNWCMMENMSFYSKAFVLYFILFCVAYSIVFNFFYCEIFKLHVS